MTFQQRRAITRLAVQAANDQEYGYDGAAVVPSLLEIDPLYDWAPLVWQIELEEGVRTMGPRPLTQGYTGGVAGIDAIIAELYVSHVMEHVERGNPLFYMLSDGRGV